jgi:hypothetical protein
MRRPKSEEEAICRPLVALFVWINFYRKSLTRTTSKRHTTEKRIAGPVPAATYRRQLSVDKESPVELRR